MDQISTQQLIFLVLLAITIAVVIPRIQKFTGKSLSEILFGTRTQTPLKGTAASSAPTRERRQTNGSRNDLTVFISQLLKTAKKNGMQLVAPGAIEHNGTSARLLALVIHPSGVTGVYCLGFGGTITPSTQAGKPWKQHMNGQDHTFDNPLSVCSNQYQLVRSAMDEAGIQADLNIVTVFTNPHATLQNKPKTVYTKKEFLSYLAETNALKSGDVDIRKTAVALAGLAHATSKKTSK